MILARFLYARAALRVVMALHAMGLYRDGRRLFNHSERIRVDASARLAALGEYDETGVAERGLCRMTMTKLTDLQIRRRVRFSLIEFQCQFGSSPGIPR